MATDTAVAPNSTSARTDPTRHLWQLPVFLLGVAAFVCAWQGWITFEVSPNSSFPREVAALKSAHEKVQPDAAELKTCLGKVAAGLDTAPPDQAPYARFQLGSGYV